MTSHSFRTCLETQNGPNYWYARWFFGWCSLRQRNWRLNSGLKSATIVTDPLHDIHLSLTKASNFLLDKGSVARKCAKRVFLLFYYMHWSTLYFSEDGVVRRRNGAIRTMWHCTDRKCCVEMIEEYHVMPDQVSEQVIHFELFYYLIQVCNIVAYKEFFFFQRN